MKTLPLLSMALLAACSTLNTNHLEPGMTKAQVTASLGPPETRSFKGDDEAWQYHGIVAMGQCRYSTVWITKGVVVSVTSRTGPSPGPGCGPGSREVDWGQMPKPSIDINVTHK